MVDGLQARVHCAACDRKHTDHLPRGYRAPIYRLRSKELSISNMVGGRHFRKIPSRNFTWYVIVLETTQVNTQNPNSDAFYLQLPVSFTRDWYSLLENSAPMQPHSPSRLCEESFPPISIDTADRGTSSIELSLQLCLPVRAIN